MEIPPKKIRFKDIDFENLNINQIGLPVIREDRGYLEYGILMGWEKNLILVNFNNCIHNLRLLPNTVKFVNVELNK